MTSESGKFYIQIKEAINYLGQERVSHVMHTFMLEVPSVSHSELSVIVIVRTQRCLFPHVL